MKTLYLECNMGAAGDMLTAALLELHPDPAGFLARLNALGLEGVRITAEKAVKCGVTGTHVSVTVNGQEEESLDVHHHDHTSDAPLHDHSHEHHHHHSSLHDIEHIVSHLALPQQVRQDVLAVYQLIAQAESVAHNKPVTEIHFHEVGAMDAVADVTAVCLLLHELAPERIMATPVHVGSGEVHCAHGILPVPAPATAWLLRGIPTYGGQVRGELCTPTGAALLRHFVQEFGPQPVMRVEKIGYGCGKKDFPQANCLRASLGETMEAGDRVLELRCNLDDMTPEGVGFAMEQLLAAGALDVYTSPIGMKKNRPGVLLTCLCRSGDRERMLSLLFRHTSTLGIRQGEYHRETLTRTVETVDTPYGPVRVKTSSGWGVQRRKAEYDDLAKIAAERGLSLSQVEAELEAFLK